MDNVTKAIIEALGAHLKANMPKLQLVSYDWPTPNVKLRYPSMTIMSGDPEFSNMMPEQLSTGPVGSKSLSKVLYEVGLYDFKLQIDIWCGSKEERFRMYDEFFRALNSSVEVMGLSLELKKYYGVFARYDLVGYSFSDDEEGSQRAEWRARLDVVANCKAILDKSQPIITQPIETEPDITDNVIQVEAE